MKSKIMFLMNTGLAALVLNTPAIVSAKTKASPAPSATAAPMMAEAPVKQRAIPYRGKIASVDSGAKTFTIAGKEKSRTFKITDRSTVTKADQPATMKEVVADEEVRGSYWKMADGSLEAKTVKLGPLSDAEKAAEDARKAKRAEKKAGASSPSPEQH
jgi:hypothetical protein